MDAIVTEHPLARAGMSFLRVSWTSDWRLVGEICSATGARVKEPRAAGLYRSASRRLPAHFEITGKRIPACIAVGIQRPWSPVLPPPVL
jgi:hypothetical protein